jgi:hypothetical protein
MREWLQRIDHHVPLRYALWLLCGAAALLSAASWALLGQGALPALLFGALALLGLRDRLQTRRSVLRNYPVASATCAYLLEYIRPEIRQYFIEPTTRPRRSRASSARWSTSAPRATRQAPLRHAAGRACARLRVDQPLDGADAAADARLPRDHRCGSGQTLFGQHLQHLGDELRRAQRQRHPGAERRRPAAASPTTPARARSASTTACTAAI